jgi:ABC-2 type transport system ATP-binding protein
LLFGEKILNNRKILRKIWYAPEQAYYYEHLTWAEFLTYMWLISWIKKSEIKSKVDYYLDLVGLSFAKKTLIKNYSKWMKQRLWIASSIIHSPELVFFDEPMSGLDPLWRKLVKDLISDLNNQWMTVFFNTHILSDVEEIANRFAIINKGEIVYQWKISDLKKPLEDFFMEKVSCEKIV